MRLLHSINLPTFGVSLSIARVIIYKMLKKRMDSRFVLIRYTQLFYIYILQIQHQTGTKKGEKTSILKAMMIVMQARK